MMKRLIIITLLLSAALHAGAQVYIATDKSCYVAGDRIWCSVFCSPGPSVAWLELVSQDGPAAFTRISIRGGRGGGSLAVPFGTPTGNYQLCGYIGESDEAPAGPVISIFNTLTTERVKDGVEIVEPEQLGGPAQVQTGYGLSARTDGTLRIENTSGRSISCSISLYREDSLQGAAYRSIAGFSRGAGGPDECGEVLRAVPAGPDAAAVTDSLNANPRFADAILAIPGAKTDCYSGVWQDGAFVFATENIYGEGDIVYMLSGLGDDVACHLEPVSPFASKRFRSLPPLKICRSQEADLLRRTAAMKEAAGKDTLAVTLPMRREHFFLTHECVRYVLDDYTRFPTMEEVFVEITPLVKLRRNRGKPQIYVLMEGSVAEAVPRWGPAVVMVDGVPVTDQRLIETYDPAIVKVVEVYPYKYKMGGENFDGVVNLVTFGGNMPGVQFGDNVRIYGFHGCAWPQEHRGKETLYWHPLINLEPGFELEIPSEGLQDGVAYTLSVEGVTDSGRAVYLRKTFVR
ncbi:MAG: hypothetical protein IJU68_03355 [Bacteroidales bacterium]|nr:hypothetical protein [Bacteroidales bacterium]